MTLITLSNYTAVTTARTTTTPPTKLTHIFGTRGAEIFMIVLVLLFGFGLMCIVIKYVQIRNKLKEYKLNGGETGNPSYDNPMYGGGHRSPERYIKTSSIPFQIRNKQNLSYQ